MSTEKTYLEQAKAWFENPRNVEVFGLRELEVKHKDAVIATVHCFPEKGAAVTMGAVQTAVSAIFGLGSGEAVAAKIAATCARALSTDYRNWTASELTREQATPSFLKKKVEGALASGSVEHLERMLNVFVSLELEDSLEFLELAGALAEAKGISA